MPGQTTRQNGTVTQAGVDKSVQPPIYSVTVTYPTTPSPVIYTGLDRELFDRLDRALGTSLKVDVTTDEANTVTGVSTHT